MRLALLMLCLLSQQVIVGQDSCAVFGNENVQPRMMGYVPEPVQWQDDRLRHTHTLYRQLSQTATYLRDISRKMPHEHLNEEFEEAMLNFDLVDIVYHDFDEFGVSGPMLQP